MFQASGDVDAAADKVDKLSVDDNQRDDDDDDYGEGNSEFDDYGGEHDDHDDAFWRC